MNVVTYLQEVRAELQKVTWPKRETAVRMTGVVLGGSLVVGLYVGGLDYLFTNLLGLFFK